MQQDRGFGLGACRQFVVERCPATSQFVHLRRKERRIDAVQNGAGQPLEVGMDAFQLCLALGPPLSLWRVIWLALRTYSVMKASTTSGCIRSDPSSSNTCVSSSPPWTVSRLEQAVGPSLVAAWQAARCLPFLL